MYAFVEEAGPDEAASHANRIIQSEERFLLERSDTSL
jgi:hypothetical protein